MDAQGAPVFGAQVLVTAADNDDVLSERICACDAACGKKLLECGCGEAAGQIAEAISDRRGEVVALGSTLSGADGTFELPGLSEGEVSVWGEHPSAGIGALTAAKVGPEPLELRLAPGHFFSGTVRNEESRPVAGAAVTAVFVAHSRFFDGTTDAKGKFRLGPLPSGKYELVATSPGLLPSVQAIEAKAPEAVTRAEDLVLDPPRTVSGQVEDEAHAPVVDVEVRLSGGHKKASVKVDGQGRFAFPGLRMGQYQVEATRGARGAAVEVWVSRRNIDQLLLTLADPAGADVWVRDAAGHPTEGARVTATAASFFSVATKPSSGTTDATGHARLQLFHAGRATVHVSLEGYLDTDGWRSVELRAGAVTKIEITLRRAVRVSGIVVGPHQEPVEEADLLFSRIEPVGGSDESDDSRGRATSSGDGGFVASLPLPGRYSVRVHHPAFIDAALELSAPAAGVTLHLDTGGEAEGIVVDRDGHPQPDVEVFTEAINEAGAIDPSWEHHAKTDAAGRFKMQGFADGRYLAVASQDDATQEPPRSRRASVRFEVQERHTNPLVLTFQGGEIRGRVVDAQGEGLVGARVQTATPGSERTDEMPTPQAPDDRVVRLHLMRLPEDIWEATDIEGNTAATAGEGGAFRLENVAPGSYILRAWKTGYTLGPSPILAREGESGVRVPLFRVGHIRGRCVDETGAPVRAFSVNLEQFESSTGAFEFQTERPGATSLHIGAEGFLPVEKKIDAVPGQDQDIGIVTLSRGRVIQGEVVDERSGEPVRGARVFWTGGSAPRDIFLDEVFTEQKETDARGHFSIEGVPSGAVTVVASLKGRADARAEVPAGQAFIHLVIPAGRRVSGHVLDAQGAPVVGAHVSASSARSEGSFEAVSGAQGVYALDGLGPGTYWVLVVANTAAFQASYVARSVVVTEEGAPTLDFQAPAQAATLKVRLAPTLAVRSWSQPFLFPGDVPVAPGGDNWLASGPFALPVNDEPPWVFANIPLGKYTLFASGDSRTGALMDRESVAVSQPGTSEVSFQPGPNVVAAP